MKQIKISKSITDREGSSIRKYLKEITKEPLITIDEETRLVSRIRKGDKEAEQKLIRANLRFVVSIAKRYLTPHLHLNDLINEGNIGLIKAAQRFDETRGFKFISYAVWWIRQSIQRAVTENQHMVRVPSSQVDNERKVYFAKQKFVAKNEREPTDEELAKILNLKIERVKDSHNVSQIGYISFDIADASIEADEPVSISYNTIPDRSVVPPDTGLVFTESLRQDIFEALKKLSKNEARVIIKYFNLDGEGLMTLEDIAQSMETPITRERVRQILNNGLKRIKNRKEVSEKLKGYMI